MSLLRETPHLPHALLKNLFLLDFLSLSLTHFSSLFFSSFSSFASFRPPSSFFLTDHINAILCLLLCNRQKGSSHFHHLECFKRLKPYQSQLLDLPLLFSSLHKSSNSRQRQWNLPSSISCRSTHTHEFHFSEQPSKEPMYVCGGLVLAGGGGGEKWLTTLTPFPVSPCLNVFLSRYIYDYFFKKYHASLFFFLSLSLAFSVSFHFLFLLGPFSLWLFVRSCPCFISKRQSKFTIHTLFWRWQRQTKGCMCYMSVMGT